MYSVLCIVSIVALSLHVTFIGVNCRHLSMLKRGTGLVNSKMSTFKASVSASTWTLITALRSWYIVVLSKYFHVI